MSDEEEYSEEEVEEEIEESEAAPVEAEKPAEPEPEEGEEIESAEPEESAPQATAQVESQPSKLRHVDRPAHKQSEQEGQQLTEAEQAMLAAKKRHEEEMEQRAINADNQRKLELKNVEEELVLLKQRQAERKKEREIEDREFAERRRKDDERRHLEIEERKLKREEQKRLKEEEKLKRQQVMSGSFVTTSVGSNKKKEKTAEQQAEAKRNYLASIQKADVSNLLPNDLKAKIKQLHSKILRLESDKYDLQQRHGRQDYDLKELTERESQRARNKALALGVEVEKAESGQVRPPKVSVASKHDRQKDHRSYGERREKFENPYEKPAPSIAHGSGRPPPEWGRKQNEEIENVRKALEPSKYYVEAAPVEGDLAKPPVPIIPLQVPAE